jgi:peptide/nickel transport system ATP-binding protein
MEEAPLISVEGLTVEFSTEDGLVRAVDNISFSSKRGMITGIVGESGSGKSVTTLSIMKLIPFPPGKIISGKILFHPHHETLDLAGLNENRIQHVRGRDIGMIFQEPMSSLNPVMSCGRQITEVIRRHRNISQREARSLCLNLFREVRLPRPPDVYKSYPHQLSGGQKQRVMIAIAISCQPALLIADEPTTALDVTVQRDILNLLLDLQQKHGMGILFITHDLGVVADIAQQVLVMYRGQIVESGKISQVFHHPRHPYTKGLLACRPPLHSRPGRLLTVKDFLSSSRDKKSNEIYKNQKNPVKPDDRRKTRHKALYASKPLLSIQDLCVHYPLKKNLWGRVLHELKAVDHVSLDVYPGETMGLVGESGCGKTTLGRAILRLTDPSAGKIFYKNHDILGLNGHAMRMLRKNIQIIFQDPYSSLNPRITIGSAIGEPLLVHGLVKKNAGKRKRILELLDQAGLPASYAGRYPHELSGGQRQRVCIARALAVEPEFIICDESVSALDVSVQAQILNLLNDLKKEYQLTYIFISHDLSVVKYMSDRMAVMQTGKIMETGDADEIYAKPKTEYTKKLISAIPGSANTIEP